MAFAPVQAGLSGIRLIGREPLAVAAWSAASMAGAVLATAVTSVLVGGRLMEAYASGSDAAAVTRAWIAWAEWTVLNQVLAIAVMSVVYAAVYRALVRPERRLFAHLRLGPDELRLTLVFLGLMAAISVPLAGVYLASWVAMNLDVAPLQVLGAQRFLAVQLAAMGAMLVLSAWAGVRLSLAPVLAFAERRVRPVRAWRLTRGRFWPMLGCYAVSWLAAGVILTVSTALALALAAAVWGVSVEAAWQLAQETESGALARDLEPARLAFILAQAAGFGPFYAVLAAPAVAVWEDLQPGADPSAAFA